MTVARKSPRARPCRKISVMEIKALVRHRDGYRCTECGMTARQHKKKYGKNLDVHRLEPGSPYKIRGCVTLCRGCHGPKPRSPICRSQARPYHTIQMRAVFVPLLERLTQRAIRLLLEREGLWPPRPDR